MEREEKELTEKELCEFGLMAAKAEIERLDGLIRDQKQIVRAYQTRLDSIKSEEKGYGNCKRCNVSPAVTDYNGHGHYVCRTCDNILEREFEEEYD